MSRWNRISTRPPVDARGHSPKLWLHYAPGDRLPVKGSYTYFGEDYTGMGFSQDEEGADLDDDGEYLDEAEETFLPTHWALAMEGEEEPPERPEALVQTFTTLCTNGALHDYRKHGYGPADDQIVGHYYQCVRCGTIWDMCA